MNLERGGGGGSLLPRRGGGTRGGEKQGTKWSGQCLMIFSIRVSQGKDWTDVPIGVLTFGARR